jgi:hypothetical protein
MQWVMQQVLTRLEVVAVSPWDSNKSSTSIILLRGRYVWNGDL